MCLRFALLFLIGSMLVADQPPPETILRQALAYHQAGDLEGAVRSYREFLQLRPEAAQIRSNLGASLVGLGRYDEAIKEYQQAVVRLPDNPGIRLNFALAYYKAGQVSQAMVELEQVVKRQPENLQAVLLLADCHLRRGENRAVIAALTPYERDSETNLGIAYLLGTALIRDHQVRQGQVLIDRILRAGDSAEGRLLLGTTKMMANDFAGARADLQKAVELKPNLPEAYSYYGLSLLQTGDSTGAAAAFRKALEQDPNDFQANLNLGALLRQEQEYPRSVIYLKRALQLRPSDAGVRYQIASVALATGQTEQARTDLESLVKDAPAFTEAHVTLATVYYRLKRKEDGDRERAIVQSLNAAEQAKQPGAKTP